MTPTHGFAVFVEGLDEVCTAAVRTRDWCDRRYAPRLLGEKDAPSVGGGLGAFTTTSRPFYVYCDPSSGATLGSCVRSALAANRGEPFIEGSQRPWSPRFGVNVLGQVLVRVEPTIEIEPVSICRVLWAAEDSLNVAAVARIVAVAEEMDGVGFFAAQVASE
jgi:hypothetical protein